MLCCQQHGGKSWMTFGAFCLTETKERELQYEESHVCMNTHKQNATPVSGDKLCVWAAWRVQVLFSSSSSFFPSFRYTWRVRTVHIETDSQRWCWVAESIIAYSPATVDMNIPLQHEKHRGNQQRLRNNNLKNPFTPLPNLINSQCIIIPQSLMQWYQCGNEWLLLY